MDGGGGSGGPLGGIFAGRGGADFRLVGGLPNYSAVGKTLNN